MEKKIFMVIILILFQQNLIESNVTHILENCLIQNLEYDDEYLYGSHGNVFTFPLNKVKDSENLNWSFMPIIQINRRIGHLLPIGEYYFIKNHNNQSEYLCGSNTEERTDLSKQLIKLVKLNPNKLNLNCYWKVEKTNWKKEEMYS
jgi:hypothetical protein